MYKRVIFGDIANPRVAQLEDISMREGTLLTLLALAVLFFGVWPAPLFEVMDATLNHLLEHVSQSKLG